MLLCKHNMSDLYWNIKKKKKRKPEDIFENFSTDQVY